MGSPLTYAPQRTTPQKRESTGVRMSRINNGRGIQARGEGGARRENNLLFTLITRITLITLITPFTLTTLTTLYPKHTTDIDVAVRSVAHTPPLCHHPPKRPKHPKHPNHPPIDREVCGVV
jgi:hypothetical protein